MSSSDSTVTYTSISSKDVLFWGILFFGMEQPDSPEAAPQSPIQTPPDEHVLPIKEQPLPLVVSPIAESPEYVVELDPEEDPEDESSRDDADDEDKDEKDEEEGRRRRNTSLRPTPQLLYLLLSLFPHPREYSLSYHHPLLTVLLLLELGLLFGFSCHIPSTRGERLARCTAPSACPSPPPVPSSLLPSSGCPTQIQTLRLASTQALIDAVIAALPSPPLPPPLYIPPPVDHRDDIPKTEMPPRKRDTWVDPAETVPEIAPMTIREAEIAKLQETDRRRQAQMVETLLVMGDMRREMGDMQAELLALREQPRRARQPGEDARVPNHQDAPKDADSHI
nr:hypothetical protein [Tanacetum cinerariifolium]